MRQNVSEPSVGIMLDPLALRALDDQLHDHADDLDALDRARAAVGNALRDLDRPRRTRLLRQRLLVSTPV